MPIFRNLMQMVNASFEPVAQLRKLSLLWTNNKEKIRGFLLDQENRNFIKVSQTGAVAILFNVGSGPRPDIFLQWNLFSGKDSPSKVLVNVKHRT